MVRNRSFSLCWRGGWPGQFGRGFALALVLAFSHLGLIGNAFAGPVDFDRDIRPILSENCFACHGPDEQQRKAKLRFDHREDALKAAKSGDFAIVPGDPAKSQLIARITSKDEDELMPPLKTGKKLHPQQIELLRQWIIEGAKWQEHWAFVAPQRPPLPKVKTPAKNGNEIDAFVRARLEQAKLSPAPEADKLTLIRRVTFDLTGLPPTLAEIDAFVADKSAGAYAKLVDRLLSSPRYGEHMARYWLDAVRYADSHGYHIDGPRDMWPYRDWVVNAFNRNLPFDEFTVEQLAGDLLPKPTTEQLVASGYNRCNLTSNEGGAIAAEFQAKSAFDRVETTATVWMGLTWTCARCHTHKYDPITHHEYYELYAFFNSMDVPVFDENVRNPRPFLKLPTPAQTQRQKTLREQIAAGQTKLEAMKDAVEKSEAKWVAKWREQLAATPGLAASNVCTLTPWQVLGPLRNESLKQGLDTRYEPERKLNFKKVYVGAFDDIRWANRPEFEDGKSHALVSEIYSRKGNGVFFLHRAINAATACRAEITARADHLFKIWVNDQLVATRDAVEQPGDGMLRVSVDLKPGENKVLMKVVNYEAELCFFTFKVDFDYGDQLPADIAAILATESPKDEQLKKVRNYYRTRVATDFKRQSELVASLQYEDTAIENSIATTLISKEMTKPRETFLLNRGEYDQPGAAVSRGVPAVLPPLLESEATNRLGLARWLVSTNHPLTARVTVNRFWQQYFGAGLVRTPEDFGVQGERPSHPELLDWLATEFMRTGWDVKKLQRLIVMSATYRQASRTTPELHAKDPENRLLARGPRFRVDAEVLRDNVLFVSGLLVDQPGGRSVKPFEPLGLWETVSHDNRLRYVADTDANQYRRSLYTSWKRQSPPPNMLVFDAPTRETCTVRRARTSTPLQALTLLNDPQFVEASRAFAKRIITEGGRDEAGRIAFAFRLATARQPAASEVKVLEKILREALARFRDDRVAAQSYLTVGDFKPRENLDLSELAAWSTVASVLLNLDEAMTKN